MTPPRQRPAPGETGTGSTALTEYLPVGIAVACGSAQVPAHATVLATAGTVITRHPATATATATATRAASVSGANRQTATDPPPSSRPAARAPSIARPTSSGATTNGAAPGAGLTDPRLLQTAVAAYPIFLRRHGASTAARQLALAFQHGDLATAFPEPTTRQAVRVLTRHADRLFPDGVRGPEPDAFVVPADLPRIDWHSAGLDPRVVDDLDRARRHDPAGGCHGALTRVVNAHRDWQHHRRAGQMPIDGAATLLVIVMAMLAACGRTSRARQLFGDHHGDLPGLGLPGTHARQLFAAHALEVIAHIRLGHARRCTGHRIAVDDADCGIPDTHPETAQQRHSRWAYLLLTGKDGAA